MTERPTTETIPASALALGLAGVLPFAAAALSLWVPLPLLGPAEGLRLGVIYGAIILSFLGGIRWGAALGPYAHARRGLEFGASVLGSLAGLAAAFLPAVPALSLLIAGFLMQALWDVTSAEAGRLPGWFGRLRMILTGGAVISLVALLVAAVAI
jgi:hypothetical protein